VSATRDSVLTLHQPSPHTQACAEPRPAHRSCYPTGSRTLTTTGTPTLPRVRAVAEVATLHTASPAPRKWLGLYALKPWYTRRLIPFVNAAVAH
jgi:CDP-diacylglycerol---glycerol-3-phosphate 3-phosphatidyltransferase